MNTLKRKAPQQNQLIIFRKYVLDSSNDHAEWLRKSQINAVSFVVIEAARQLSQSIQVLAPALPMQSQEIEEEE